MKTTAKASGRAMSMPGGIAIGTGISLAVTCILSFILAWLVEQGHLKQENIGYGAMIVLLLCAYIGAITARGRVKHRKTLVCMLCGAGYFLCLLAATAMFFGGQYSAVGATGLLILAGAGCAALTNIRPKKRGKRRHIRVS